MNPAATLAIYLAAALGEIAGCFAFWAWLRLGKSAWWAVAGVAGSVYAIMIRGDYVDPGTINTFGFDAIAVSLLGANNPLAVIPAGLLFGALDSAGSGISLGTNLPPTLIDGIIGLVVLFVAAPELFRTLGRFTNLGGERP